MLFQKVLFNAIVNSLVGAFLGFNAERLRSNGYSEEVGTVMKKHLGSKVKSLFSLLEKFKPKSSLNELTQEEKFLRWLIQTSSVDDLPQIFPLIFSNHPELSKQAAKQFAQILSLVVQDSGKRELDQFSSLLYLEILPEKFKHFYTFPPEIAVHLFGVTTLNANGYLREAGLEGLMGLDHPDMLRYVLLRLNDWVPPVNEKAHLLLQKKLPMFSAELLVRNYQWIEALDRRKRSGCSRAKQMILDRLTDPHSSDSSDDSVNPKFPKYKRHVEELLRLSIISKSVGQSLFCWSVLESEEVRNPELIKKALESPFLEVRVRAVARLRKSPFWEESVLGLLKDDSPRIRYTTLKFFESADIQTHRSQLMELLLDESALVRQISRLLLGPELDYPTFYETRWIEALESKEGSRNGILSGLLETAQSDFSEEIVEFLTHKRVKVRILVLNTLDRFAHPNTAQFAVQALRDPSNKVKANASRVLSKTPRGYDQKAVIAELESNDLPTQRAALRVLGARGGLESLRDLLKVTLEHKELRTESWYYLQKWYLRYRVSSFFQKSEPLIAEIETLAKTLEPELLSAQKALLSEILFLLRTI